MGSTFHRWLALVGTLLYFYQFDKAFAKTSSPTRTVHTVASPDISSGLPATCDFRTINYITDSLPQQCLRSSWSHTNLIMITSPPSNDNIASQATVNTEVTTNPDISNGNEIVTESTKKQDTLPRNIPTPPLQQSADTIGIDYEDGELNQASFLSFEEWKKQTLEKSSQSNLSHGNKKVPGGIDNKGDINYTSTKFEVLQNDSKLDQGFDDSKYDDRKIEAVQASDATEHDADPGGANFDSPGHNKDQYRSKDAGKTYKERFSYASFDAGATIRKSHSGAKNSKAVLTENKDSYMLSECATDGKFIILELSEDIWIDTIALANYEFFSSMIRTFRVSVSDRYPTKSDKWKDIGTYEARNSREVQAFLIENPQIWTRYLRIEFLNHYGNEYYCPVSLIRVHGTRMLESWKETETNNDDDDQDDHNDQDGHKDNELTDDQSPSDSAPRVPQDFSQEDQRTKIKSNRSQLPNESLESTKIDFPGQDGVYDELHIERHVFDTTAMTPWSQIDANISNLFSEFQINKVCLMLDTPKLPLMTRETTQPATTTLVHPQTQLPSDIATSRSDLNQATIVHPASIKIIPIQTDFESFVTVEDHSSDISSSITTEEPAPPSVAASSKDKTSSTSTASSSLPTIQESFYKAVSRRLQLLEANSSLSLKYIEEQSKLLRDAFTNLEKKQLQKTIVFLDTLNATVLVELQGFRQQYDEIWQSTVISLETQREESRREILAISSRLNILADEVIFQKRMSIVQSILLLLCLGIVIFSQVSGVGYLEPSSTRSKAQMTSPLRSALTATPPESPEFRGTIITRDLNEIESPSSEASPLAQFGSRPFQSIESLNYSALHKNTISLSKQDKLSDESQHIQRSDKSISRTLVATASSFSGYDDGSGLVDLQEKSRGKFRGNKSCIAEESSNSQNYKQSDSAGEGNPIFDGDVLEDTDSKNSPRKSLAPAVSPLLASRGTKSHVSGKPLPSLPLGRI